MRTVLKEKVIENSERTYYFNNKRQDQVVGICDDLRFSNNYMAFSELEEDINTIGSRLGCVSATYGAVYED